MVFILVWFSSKRTRLEDWSLSMTNVTTIIEMAIFAGVAKGYSTFVRHFLWKLASDAIHEIAISSFGRVKQHACCWVSAGARLAALATSVETHFDAVEQRDYIEQSNLFRY